METGKATGGATPPAASGSAGESSDQPRSTKISWKRLLGASSDGETGSMEQYKDNRRERWTMGILNDKETDEVPGECSYVSSRVA